MAEIFWRISTFQQSLLFSNLNSWNDWICGNCFSSNAVVQLIKEKYLE